MSARLIQVIETTLTTRGSGKDKSDPMRTITQYWSTDGLLLAEATDWLVVVGVGGCGGGGAAPTGSADK